MHPKAGSRSATGGRLVLVGALLVCAFAEGCCGPIASLRQGPAGRVPPCPEAATECAHLDGPADAACAIPPAGYCGADDCPSLLFCARPHLWRFLGPIAAWPRLHAPAEEGLQPPHSRFHPVPTAPVFAQRDEYDAPVENTLAPVTRQQAR
jgi:hypothetical protein